MTITIVVDPSSVKRSPTRPGTDFSFTEGGRRHRVHVPDEAVSQAFPRKRISASQTEGIVHRHALSIALILTGRLGGRFNANEFIVDHDLLDQAR